MANTTQSEVKNIQAEVAADAHGSADAHKPSLLTVDGGLIIWVWITFFVFLILLKKFAWGPILSALDEREGKLKKALEDADKSANALEEATKKQEEILSSAKAEAAEIVSNARDAAKSLSADMEAKAKEQAQRLLDDANKTIEGEKNKAIGAIRKEAGELAIAAATKLVNANLDDDKNRELVSSYIDELTK